MDKPLESSVKKPLEEPIAASTDKPEQSLLAASIDKPTGSSLEKMPDRFEYGGHRRLTRESTKDLIFMVLALVIIFGGMMMYRSEWFNPAPDDSNSWYYERISNKRPPASPGGR